MQINILYMMKFLELVTPFAIKLVCIIAFIIGRILCEIVNDAVNVKTCRLQAYTIFTWKRFIS